MKCPQNRAPKIFLSGLTVIATLASVSLVAPKPTVARTESPDRGLEVSTTCSDRRSDSMTIKDQPHKILPIPSLQTRDQAVRALGKDPLMGEGPRKSRSLANRPMLLLSRKTPSLDESR